MNITHLLHVLHKKMYSSVADATDICISTNNEDSTEDTNEYRQ